MFESINTIAPEVLTVNMRYKEVKKAEDCTDLWDILELRKKNPTGFEWIKAMLLQNYMDDTCHLLNRLEILKKLKGGKNGR